uniref:MD-2-related lipid-recognition domain-containing protein n=1 Tax=Timema genevievae TaxID=629358 RepID=A0A7R9JWV2_TIMGE|nr:unnamed protein product [Timema genevievae]
MAPYQTHPPSTLGSKPTELGPTVVGLGPDLAFPGLHTQPLADYSGLRILSGRLNDKITILEFWNQSDIHGVAGSKAGKFSSITVSGCTDQQPVCVLKRRTNTTIDITFTPCKYCSIEDLKKVTTVVHGIVAGVPVLFNVPDPEACDTCLKCPLSANSSYDYRATLPIARFYPTIQLIVKWELQDELTRDIHRILLPYNSLGVKRELVTLMVICPSGANFCTTIATTGTLISTALTEWIPPTRFFGGTKDIRPADLRSFAVAG